ncbi:capsular polysaccharide biosynthesis protein [Halolactibacillus miurensis]|uniref:Capsular polysaccharide biosynthesis protein n=1 Tax=Halolactibacillus miurensis TaxID=306541 RepID=A0A1I6V316_9BACI|nr:Wzz/FepE/Etk N-terminal domain-containing protein [Halolactibacillus miurensis]GEM05794.1 capsular polysaccharide biosynthesis protein [Halolactibacillus miurensis]SFT07957.1 Capsular polysaccharide biosynthesis protein [Halolactibacillus miurensis]
MEETISLKELIVIIKKRLGMIIATSLLLAVLGGMFTFFFITKEYEVSTQFLVNQQQTDQTNTIQQSDIRTNIELINTYNVIIKSNRILEEVANELDLDLSATQLGSKLTVTNENQSQVVTVTVRDTDPRRAENIANTTVDVFQEEIYELMNVDNVSVLNPADAGINPLPVSPNLTLNIVIAFILGAMLSIGLTFLLEYLDTSVKTEEDIERYLDLPVIGTVSHMAEEDIQQPTAKHHRARKERGA